MNTNVLLKKLGRLFPKKIAVANHDFVGLMVGKLPLEVKSIVLCLDYDRFVYDYLKNNSIKPDLIITHHPFIYGKKKDVFLRDHHKKSLYDKTVSDDFVVYSFHTNFDGGNGGMNDTLAKLLELNDIKPLENEPIARGGVLKNPMTFNDLVLYVKDRLNVKTIKTVRGNNEIIKSVAIIGGGGASYFRVSQDAGYDLFISGDARHSTRRDILIYEYNYFDVAHEVERIFMSRMAEIIDEIDSDIRITIIDHEEEPEIL